MTVEQINELFRKLEQRLKPKGPYDPLDEEDNGVWQSLQSALIASVDQHVTQANGYYIDRIPSVKQILIQRCISGYSALFHTTEKNPLPPADVPSVRDYIESLRGVAVRTESEYQAWFFENNAQAIAECRFVGCAPGPDDHRGLDLEEILSFEEPMSFAWMQPTMHRQLTILQTLNLWRRCQETYMRYAMAPNPDFRNSYHGQFRAHGVKILLDRFGEWIQTVPQNQSVNLNTMASLIVKTGGTLGCLLVYPGEGTGIEQVYLQELQVYLPLSFDETIRDLWLVQYAQALSVRAQKVIQLGKFLSEHLNRAEAACGALETSRDSQRTPQLVKDILVAALAMKAVVQAMENLPALDSFDRIPDKFYLEGLSRSLPNMPSLTSMAQSIAHKNVSAFAEMFRSGRLCNYVIAEVKQDRGSMRFHFDIDNVLRRQFRIPSPESPPDTVHPQPSMNSSMQ